VASGVLELYLVVGINPASQFAAVFHPTRKTTIKTKTKPFFMLVIFSVDSRVQS
jgi:hypothetical protein